MSVAVESGGKSGKKSVNADLNLVPYIDLLTCMVAFLLITAVWSQLARLEAHQ
jgi:biopolymer transport protein ExbD